MEATRELVLSVAQRDFPTEDPATVIALLDAYGTEPHERERDRVHLAILRLSDGDAEKLLYWVGIAKQDYRDALAWAEYPSQMRAPVNPAPEISREIRQEDRKQYLAWLSKTQ
jgi:hypothetical protein